jgi:hypothetical protein
LKRAHHAGRCDPTHFRTIKKAQHHHWRRATPALALALASCALTAAFSRSQPIDSQLRRTSSLFCCKALFGIPSFALEHASPVRGGQEPEKTTLSASLFSSATG